jgi:ABC-type uncharacterized transport system substrate-binding protein
MVVNSYHAGHPWVRAHNGALREKLAGKAAVSCIDLDTKRIPPSRYGEAAERAWRAIVAARPDVVVLTDDNAVRLLGQRVMDRGIPLVFLGVNQNPRKYLGGLEGATGVLERPLYKRSLIYVRDIMGPSLKRCLILFDRGDTSKVIRETVFKNQNSMRLGKIDVDVLFLDTFAAWREAILSAGDKGYDVIFVGLYHSLRDAAGDHVPSDEVLAWSSANAPVPVFGYWDFTVGRGRAVGGLVDSGRPQGKAAAELVLKILAGARPGSLYPVIPKDGQFVFSRSEMRRWGILLPSNIINGDEPVRFVD